MLRFPFWEELPYFFQVAEAGSLRRAADSLRISPATLSRRIRNLEQALGGPLFIRQPDRMVLTPVGQQLWSRCQDLSRIARDLGDLGRGDEVASIRMTSIPCFATHLVLPGLAGFQQDLGQPVHLELDTSPDVSELGRQPFDIAVRLSRPEAGRYQVRKIGEIDVALVGGPGHLPDRGPVPLVLWAEPPNRPSRFNQALVALFPQHRPAVTAFSYQTYVEAVRQGLGFGLLPAYALPHLGGLARLPTPEALHLPRQDLWMVTRSDSPRQAVLQAFAGFLASLRPRLADPGDQRKAVD